jgi:RNA polymerase sigma-70 factor (ECF subfamily)
MASAKASKSMNNTNAAELLLLRRVAKDDDKAFGELFENYYPRLFTFLFRLTGSHGSAEELTNDVLLTLWETAGRFRGESRVSTWVFDIAYRKALAHLRKRKLKLVSFGDNDQASQAASSIDLNSQLEREDWVRSSIDELPPKQKLTVMLVYFLGLSCAETAIATDVPVSTVKTRMFHARRNMKQYLAASGVPRQREKDSGNEEQ